MKALLNILITLLIFIHLNGNQHKLVFDHILKENGLVNSAVNVIVQDKVGFIWVGTDDGLSRFDGYEFKIYKYDPNDTTSISGIRIMELYIDNEGNLWVGVQQGGLNKYNYIKDNFNRFEYKPNDSISLSNSYFRSVFEDSKQNIWLGSVGNGLFKLNKKSGDFTWYGNNANDEYSLPNNEVFSIIEDRYGDIWLGTNSKGLIKFDIKNNKFIQVDIPGEKKIYKAITFGKSLYEDTDGNIWIGTEGNGAFLWDRLNNKFSHFSTNNFLTNNTVTCFFEQNRIIWIGTDGGGINFYNKANGKFQYCRRDFFFPESINSDAVLSIFKDKHNSIWVGTFTGGINIYHQNKIKYDYYSDKGDNPKGLSHNSVISLFEDKNGKIWVGTDGGGLNLFDPEKKRFKFYTYNKNINSISGNAITSIFQDSKGNLWIGTYMKGLNLFDIKNNNFKHFKHNPDDPNSIGHNNIWCINETSDGKLLIGTFGAGLDIYNYNTNTFQHYPHNPSDNSSISHDNIVAIYEAMDKKIWIGSAANGLNLFDIDKGTFKRYIHDPDNPKSISNNDIFDMIEDNEGNLWIATNRGLNRFNTKTEKFIHYFIEDGLSSNTIENLVFDNNQCLWLTTVNGISKFDYIKKTFITFNSGIGIENNKFNNSSSIIDKNGNIYFGGINGLLVFQPNDLKQNQLIPKIIITDLKIYNKSVIPGETGSPLNKAIYDTKEITLTHRQNVITLEFVALNYINPMKNEYAYKLEGFDKEWIYTDASRRYATYSNLPGGKYYFKVKASNNDGIWNEEGTMLKIIIKPPFVKTIYFTIIIIAVILMGIYIIIKLRFKRYDRINTMLEQKVKMRTAEIHHQKSEIEAQRDEIELQKQALIDQKNKIEKQNKSLQEQHDELEKEVKKRTQDLEEAKNKAEESDKLKTAFLTNLSHEIRTPMNAIIGFSSLLADPDINNSQKNEFISHINHNSVSLLHMIDDIIDVSRIESNTIEINKNECSINVILIDLYSTYLNYKTEIGKNHIDLRLNNPHKNENIKLLTDSYRFRQVFANLLNNAFKYTEEGYIEFGIKKEDTTIICYVKDTGIGIPHDKEKMIFEHFTKIDEETERASRGTGVGLTLSKKLANLLGGNLWVETEQQVGSTFYFNIPYMPQPIEHKESLDVNWEDKTIIVAEDEDENYLLFQNILNKTKAQVFRAKTGKEVIDILNDNTNIDLVIMDIRMPVMDGHEATVELRKTNNKIPIIGVTAYTFSIDKDKMFEEGFNEVMTKPIKSNILISNLMKYLGK